MAAFVYGFAVLPTIDGFVPLVAALGLFLIPAGMCLAVPSLAIVGMGLCINFPLLLTLQARQSSDFVTFANSREAASLKERQHAESQMHQADAARQSALVAFDLAKLNLDRTVVRAPASGKITNFALRAGNYVSAGSAVGVLIENEAVYVADYFEETKLRRIHIGDRVKVDIMGEPQSASGRVAGIAAGIEDRERSETMGSLASVAPTFSWVRLAQRIPVRIEVDTVPSTVRMIAGRTATVSVRPTATER